VGYFRAAGFFYEAVQKMERKLFTEDFRPIGDYHMEHENNLYRSRWSKIATLHAPFTLVGMLFVLALMVDVVVFYVIKNPL
jgi:hypothetical protein